MLRDLVIDTLRRPRLAARRILDAGLSEGFVIEAAVLVTCAGMVLGYLALRLSTGGVDTVSAWVLENPLLGAAAQLAAMTVIVLLTFRIGRLFGGKGGFWGAWALIVWLNAMLLLLQVAQIVALVLVPPVAAVLAVVALMWALWAYANFVAELHGFQNPAIVLGAALLTGIMLFFGTAMLLAILGFTPPEMG